MDNPFIFNGYAGAQSFCDREKELEMLVNFATQDGQDGIDIPFDGRAAEYRKRRKADIYGHLRHT